jgi:hypothetical protein
MAHRTLKSFFSTADELLTADTSRVGEALLVHLKGYEALGGNSVYQNGLISQNNFRAGLEPIGHGPLRQDPEYRERQPEVTRALMEAWDWLGHEGVLTRDSKQAAPWFSISRKGQDLLKRFELRLNWERAGVNFVKKDLRETGGAFVLDRGKPEQQKKWALEWIRGQEGDTPIPTENRAGSPNRILSFVAESRLHELRELSSPDFDFRKLIRLCEELNTSYASGCLLATAVLTRALLDHVPPIFDKPTFAQVASNYGGGKTFKEAMQHLEDGARNVADEHLHRSIRKRETLPTEQQVHFLPMLDVLLGEIIRITQ